MCFNSYRNQTISSMPDFESGLLFFFPDILIWFIPSKLKEQRKVEIHEDHEY